MENVCVITDFEDASAGRKFQKIEVPENLNQYSLYSGGNCFFITNNKMTVRFNEYKLGKQVPVDVLESWVKKLKNMYPKF
jgi:hypothetical protein